MEQEVVCSISGCQKGSFHKGWCSMHYARWKRHGDPLKTVYKNSPLPPHDRRFDGICFVEECGRAVYKREMCNRHYKRWWRYNNPQTLRRATSTPGKSAAKRQEFVEKYKLDRGCADCGYSKHPAALDFDHRPGSVKMGDIRQGRSFGWEALLAEIKKCDVVCANCHRIRTVNRRRGVTDAS